MDGLIADKQSVKSGKSLSLQNFFGGRFSTDNGELHSEERRSVHRSSNLSALNNRRATSFSVDRHSLTRNSFSPFRRSQASTSDQETPESTFSDEDDAVVPPMPPIPSKHLRDDRTKSSSSASTSPSGPSAGSSTGSHTSLANSSSSTIFDSVYPWTSSNFSVPLLTISPTNRLILNEGAVQKLRNVDAEIAVIGVLPTRNGESKQVLRSLLNCNDLAGNSLASSTSATTMRLNLIESWWRHPRKHGSPAAHAYETAHSLELALAQQQAKDEGLPASSRLGFDNRGKARKVAVLDVGWNDEKGDSRIGALMLAVGCCLIVCANGSKDVQGMR